MSDVVYAAGTVCWRVIDESVHVLVIKRPRYDDISLPKGKQDTGETLPETAVRETLEETGLPVVLGVPLGTTHYVLPDGTKKEVHYWAAEVEDDRDVADFEANDEVAAVDWLPLNEARAELSYNHDDDILERFASLLAKGVTRTFAIMAVRHAEPVDMSAWTGADHERPLNERGFDQARALARRCEPWRPHHVECSPAVRCMQTMEAYAKHRDRPLHQRSDLSIDAFEAGETNLAEVASRLVDARSTTLLCSHAPVIYELVRRIADALPHGEHVSLSEASLSPATLWVIHLSSTSQDAGILAIESLAPSEGAP